ncbi:Hpt domain-containing protein [Marinimicrobium alkaliphilum]|uniref:Hpt domain-containing protein n=1 Tax=Marinimicrobium alkaliphilum TaxID=2202654 RepID=UPI000DBA6F27|nr:Hpt domain-containing protein [Marinimicrobium alkaliphilum]
MADNRNFAALDWVVAEISETLTQARQALEAYVENPQDSAQLRFCLTYMHQVRGSLQMIELHGAAMMAEEMEKLAQRMADGKIRNTGEAQEVLMRAILQFPPYLDRVQRTQQDNPLTVLPLLNDLRAVRGESLISETHLFVPNMAPARQVSGERIPAAKDDIQFRAMVQKLRQMYQYAAAGYIRDVNKDESLGYLVKVFQRMQTITQGSVRQPIWGICLALAEALEMDAVDSTVSIKNVLRQLDGEIKTLLAEGLPALDKPTSDELLHNLLYYVARSGKHSPGFASDSHLQKIYQLYNLEHALPEGREAGDDQGDFLSSPDTAAMQSVADALKDELSTVKDVLDHVLMTGERETLASDALPVMKRVADTMAVLGMADLRTKVGAQADELQRFTSADSLDGEALMTVAHRLLEIEDGLDQLVNQHGRESGDKRSEADLNLNLAQESVVRESRNGLEQAKDAIVEYIASQWNREHLSAVPATLREIRGGLEMVPMPRPARILGACARYIDERLIEAQHTPEWSELDTLADAMTGVEYYLERSTDTPDEERELLLTMAEESLASLGYAVAPKGPESQAAAPEEERESEPAAEYAIDADAELAGEDLDESAEEIELSLPGDDEESEDPERAAAETELTLDDEAEAEFETDGEAELSLESLTSGGEVEDVELTVPEEAVEPPGPVVSAEQDEDDDDEIDEEILEIFIEEAGEVTEAINEHFPRWAADFDNTDALNEFRRAFHTLKGSGRMVGANVIGELAWSVENMLNRILDGTVPSHQAQVNLIEQVRGLLPELISAFEHKQPNPAPEQVSTLEAYANRLAKGDLPDELLTLPEDNVPEPEREPEQAVEEPSVSIVEPEDDSDAQLWDIFGGEALAHLAVVEDYIAEMAQQAPLYTPPSDATQRALHTLKGSAHMADIGPIAELVTPLERFAKELRTYQVAINDDMLQLLRDAVSYTRSALDDIKAGEEVYIPRLQQFLARVAELRELAIGPLVRQEEANKKGEAAIDPELLAIFMAEEMDLLLDADQIIAQWQKTPDDLAQLEPLQTELVTLTNGARHANLPPMIDLGEQLQAVYRGVNSGTLPCDDALCALLTDAHNAMLDLVDAVAVGQNLQEPPEAIRTGLDELIARAQAPVATPESETPTEMATEEPASVPEPVHHHTGREDVEEYVSSVLDGDDELDEEIVEIFLEEANELLEDIEQSVQDWDDDWENTEPVEELKRALHTLKGGARLAGITDVGDLSHDYETLLIGIKPEQINGELFKQLHSYQDQLHAGVERVRARLDGREPEPMPEPAASVADAPVSDATANPEVSADADVAFSQTSETSDEPLPAEQTAPGKTEPAAPASGNVVPFGKDKKAKPQGDQSGQLAARRSAPQEVIKVPSDLLEELVNLAGETAISRGRMEEQVSDLGLALGEMDATIERLQEQLRRLDIETEAQVLFRQEQLGQDEDFDPLEMDRYTQLQQLSRSLMESASDLMDLKSTIADKNRDTETLLLQQSRINSELQEGLMRSRMVPFSRLVPRLRRIVRQAASELGKDVNIELDNVEGELDRSVLERMVAPLEHMLRNAVDHGIEPVEARRSAGKPDTGRIRLTLNREGGDVILRLADDGKGINRERVRQIAIERGLMKPDADLNDDEILQFILNAGFSTADKVTQISGRGVGMDVVHSEIKQLGGAMFIQSEEGQGTEFIVRLPFTVSVNRALMVQIGEDNYAIPLNTIEGIVRISPFELEHYYQDEDARFEYAGENYLVRYLGGLLDSESRPKLDGQGLPLPVVLVRSAEHTVALQVDRLQGSREIVVKTLGPQFGAVRGLSGATVTGDGSVVVILDLHALIREQLALGLKATLLDPEIGSRRGDETGERTIMVVDDSVTVRKVTGRFLEREGFQVLTAKDGAEALLQLQERVPDLMLLDIEMPRMDGFEVAQNVRSSSRLKHLPIIMITSRTGEKHRERALALGVNRYMGKPYQEDILLRNINELLQLEQTAG